MIIRPILDDRPATHVWPDCVQCGRPHKKMLAGRYSMQYRSFGNAERFFQVYEPIKKNVELDRGYGGG